MKIGLKNLLGHGKTLAGSLVLRVLQVFAVAKNPALKGRTEKDQLIGTSLDSRKKADSLRFEKRTLRLFHNLNHDPAKADRGIAASAGHFRDHNLLPGFSATNM